MKKLVIEGISHSYRNRQILKTDYFEIGANKITGLVGRNGSGKSTFLKILFGNVNADFSRILYDNIEITHAQKIKFISFLPQEDLLPHFLKVGEFIKLASININRKEQLYENYKDKLKKRIGSLSGGERRLLEILYIIYLDKEIIILDEPFRGLEPKQIVKINDIITNLNKTIIISSHLYVDLFKTTNSILLIKQGNIRAFTGNLQLLKNEI